MFRLPLSVWPTETWSGTARLNRFARTSDVRVVKSRKIA